MPAPQQAAKQDVARLVHDLKTPLAAMQTASDLIAHEPLSEQQLHHLNTLRSAINSLEELTAEILCAKPPARSVLEQLAYITNLFTPQAQQSGHTLVQLWNSKSLSAYQTQSDELQRILALLMDNAIRYSNKGPITLSAHVQQSHHTPVLIVTLTDSGPGLTQIQVANLSKTAPALGAPDGHGLGLSSACNLALECRGNLRLIANTPEEACFELSLPVTVGQNLAHTSETPEKVQVTPLAGSALVVDDNAPGRELLAAVLSSFGLSVQEAESGEQALEMQQQTPSDLVFLDLNMPEMSGTQTLQALRKRNLVASKAVFAISASIPSAQRSQLLRQGFSEALEKPVNPPALYELLRNTLSLPA